MGAEGEIPTLVELGLVDKECMPREVDIVNAESSDFTVTQPQGIQQEEHGVASSRMPGSGPVRGPVLKFHEESSDLLRAEMKGNRDRGVPRRAASNKGETGLVGSTPKPTKYEKNRNALLACDRRVS